MADDLQSAIQKLAMTLNGPTPSKQTPAVPDYGLGEPANTQEWIRRTYGAPEHRPRRMSKDDREQMLNKYGEGNPELEDLFRKAPTMTEQDVVQYLTHKQYGTGWEDFAHDYNQSIKSAPKPQ